MTTTMDQNDTETEDADRANCLQLGFSPEQVEDVVIGEDGGVTVLLNEDGQEHLDQVQHMREMHR